MHKGLIEANQPFYMYFSEQPSMGTFLTGKQESCNSSAVCPGFQTIILMYFATDYLPKQRLNEKVCRMAEGNKIGKGAGLLFCGTVLLPGP
jgi:hypothetical protein